MPKKKSKPVKLSERNAPGQSSGQSSSNADAQSKAAKSTKKKFSKKPIKPTFNQPAGLTEFLEDSEFYLPVKLEEDSIKDTLHFLGNLELNLAEPFDEEILLKVKEIWLYVSKIPGRSFLYSEWLEQGEESQTKEAVINRIDETSDVSFLAESTTGKNIVYILSPITEATRVTLRVNLLESVISSVDTPSAVNGFSNIGVQHLVKHFFSYEIPRVKFTRHIKDSSENFDLLYTSIKDHHESNWDASSLIDVQHKKLNVSLRPYQLNSVNWMLQREKLLHVTPLEELHPLYLEIVTPIGEILYYNKYTGNFVKERPRLMPPTPGGILADEMGLGKTVEVLACILANPRCPVDEIIENDLDPVDSDTQEAEVKRCISPTDKRLALIKQKRLEDAEDEQSSSEDDEKSPQAHSSDQEEYMDQMESTPEEQNNPLITRSNRKRPRAVELEVEEEEDDSTSPCKKTKVRFSDELNYIPNVKDQPLKNPKSYPSVDSASPSKSSIKAFEEQESPPVDDKALKKIAIAARRKAQTDLYMSVLAQYSSIKHLKADKNRHAGLFEGTVQRKSMFECVCGKSGESLTCGDDKVKCADCGIVQHKDCVRFDSRMGDYFCPHCNVLKPKVESRATLIVAPFAISAQWMEEIKKLVDEKTLKLFFYNGVYTDGYIQPKTLSKNDIVITTYEILSKELDYVDLPHCNSTDGRRFRNAKRYTSLPSPLVCIQWWRVCLDEAQMVECTTSKSAEMALRLNSVHRWCITGTPLQQSLQDLYGLILFLGADPFCVDVWWDVLVQGPYNTGDPVPLCELVCPLMWRTLKVDVWDQIQLPPQKQALHWINFSPVEEHFYRRQHVDCSRLLLDRLAQQSNLDIRLQSLPNDILEKLLKPLVNLRQACCHPQAVKGKFGAANKDKNKTITMQELLTNLIQKAKVECEESLRMIVSSINGLAGLSLLQEDWAHAAAYYREALAFVDENKEILKADKLPRIHSLYNLNELLESHYETIPRKDKEEDLLNEARELEAEYLSKFTATLESAKQALVPLSAKVEEIQDKLSEEEAWWSSVLQFANRTGDSQEIIERVRQALEGPNKRAQSMKKKKYQNMVSIEATLLDNTESLEKLRNHLLKHMKTLQTTDYQSLVNEAVDCHLRTIISDEAKTKAKCKLCLVSDKFKDYEKILFREVTSKDNYEHLELDDVKIFGQMQTIIWAAGDTERVLKTLLTYAKLRGVDEDWLADGSIQLKEFEAKKKEFKFLRALWGQINSYTSAVDELNMCKLRFRLRYENEPLVKNKPKKKNGDNLSSNMKNKVEHIYIIEAHEVEPQCLRLTLERSEGERSLRRRRGQLQYLMNLERDGAASAGTENPEPCPICRKILGTQWTVLLCGHCFCVDCLNELKRHQPNKRSTNCPICREDTAMGEISYVNTQMQTDRVEEDGTLQEFEEDVQKLKTCKRLRTHSAKAEAIVEEIKKILRNDPTDKILIFSAWIDMLDILQKAMTENDISCTHVKANNKKFQEAIKLFKDPQKKVTALLLPVSRGSKGLNLTEARHVFLVEPILNPATELQALGRVHRIGQNKETVVHRFVVKGTIEERMHIVLKAHQGHTKVEEDPVTLRDLYNMFASQQDHDNSQDQPEAVSNEVAVI